MIIQSILFLTLALASGGQEQWAPREKTIMEFLKMSDKDTTTCVLSGVVSKVRNYKNGNLFLSDETGSVLIYGIIDPKGFKDFYDIDVRKGDSLTVKGRRYLYDNRVIEMKNAVYVSHKEGPDHENVKKVSELDKDPSFRGGGPNDFASWVSAHLVYPQDASTKGIEGIVTVRFTVGMDGKVYDVHVVKGIYPSLDKEAIRIVSASPKWKPGIIDNEPVRVTYTIPVIFMLTDRH